MKELFLLALSCCLALAARATHLLGGEILAKNTSGLTYEISGVLYLDVVNGQAAVNAQTEIILCLGDGTQLRAKRVSSEKLEGSPNVNRSVYRAIHTYATAGRYTLTVKLDQFSGSATVWGSGREQPLALQTTLNTTLPNGTATAPNPRFFSGLRQVFSLALPKTDPDGDSLAFRIVKLLDQPEICGPTQSSNSYLFPNEVAREGTS